MPAYRSTIFVAKWSAICAAEYGTINAAISVTQQKKGAKPFQKDLSRPFGVPN